MTKAEGVLGINNNTGSDKRNLAGYLNLHFLNLWGTDRALYLKWKSSNENSKHLELSYHESGLADVPVAGDFSFQRIHQKKEWIKTSASASIYYLKTAFRYGFDISSESVYSDTEDSTGFDSEKYSNWGLFGVLNNADNPSNPTTGFHLQLSPSLQISNTKQNDTVVPKLEIDLTRFSKINDNWVVMNGLHYKEIFDRKARKYQQYMMGGFNSLRGYNEEEFYSWQLGWFNNELRYLLSKDARIYVLLDYGVYDRQRNGLKADLWGTGVGISINTRLGIIDVSYALSINNNKLVDLSEGMVHLGILSSF